MEREENPFEDPVGAEEWIKTVENEKGTIRDREIYPGIAAWIEKYGIRTLVDVGAGQGICSTKLGSGEVGYIGVEPSRRLIERAHQLYEAPRREFLCGDAYAVPLADNSVDGYLSVNTWFHLADIDGAARELARVLVPGGHFMIITPNPDAYDVWEGFYADTTKEGRLMTGRTTILLNPDDEPENYRYSELSRSIFYLHARDDLLEPLKRHGLVLDDVLELGVLPITEGRKIFLKILGRK